MEHLVALIMTAMSLGTAILGVITEIIKNRKRQKDKVVVQVVCPTPDREQDSKNAKAPDEEKRKPLLEKIPVTRRKENPNLKKRNTATKKTVPFGRYKGTRKEHETKVETNADSIRTPAEKKIDIHAAENKIPLQEIEMDEPKIRLPLNFPCSPSSNSISRILRLKDIGGAFNTGDLDKIPSPGDNAEQRPKITSRISLGKAFDSTASTKSPGDN